MLKLDKTKFKVIEKRLQKHLKDIGFLSKYQSGFRKAKSAHSDWFRLSQKVMESFKRFKHVIASIFDAEKPPNNNVWHHGLRYNIFRHGLPCIDFASIGKNTLCFK